MEILINFTLTSEDVTSIMMTLLPRFLELMIFGTVAIIIAALLLRPIIRALAERNIIRHLTDQKQVSQTPVSPNSDHPTQVDSEIDSENPKIVQLSLRVPQHKAEQIKQLIDQIDQKGKPSAPTTSPAQASVETSQKSSAERSG